MQAKQPADDLVTAKKEIDAQVEAKKKEAKEFEIRMRQKAGTVGNIIGKNVPVSLTEDDNAIMHTWDPKGLKEPEERKGILPHHEVLLRLDAMDLERGIDPWHDIRQYFIQAYVQGPRWQDTAATIWLTTEWISTKRSYPTDSTFCARRGTRRFSHRL